jgi:ATP-dependent helicase/nuclease subunit B
VNLFTIPAHAPFLDALAAAWLARGGDALAASRGLILLPTRRAARALAVAFLRATDGRPLLLPRITALGALDEVPLALHGALAAPPAVEPMPRLAVLSRMILGMDGANGAPRTVEGAWRLATELASLMDEAERAEIDLAQALPGAADAAYAEHWGKTLQFLQIVTAMWPAWLAEQGLMNPAERQVALLDAQAHAWEDDPPDEPIWIAGTTGGVPAVARLLRVVAHLPNGRVVLPGLDTDLPEAAWDALGDAHPQAGLRRLLADLQATRGDVRPWPADTVPAGTGKVPESRVALLRQALLPAAALADWQEATPPPSEGLSLLSPADQQEEAAAIALVLRAALQRPGTRAALVTPDRALAGRVGAELLRFGVVADDSAGEPLAATPPAVFLRLLAVAITEGLAPVPLLAVLKHPLAAAGLSPAACRHAARVLELACLRGPRPGANLGGLRRALDKARADPVAHDLLARMEACMEPALRMAASVRAAPGALLESLIAAAENLAASDTEAGPARLWAAEEGEALATRLAAALAALPVLPDQPRGTLPGLLDALLEGGVVRSRRALRGGEQNSEHPRVFIWGLLEARLQTVDVMVLGGLAETVWPPATDPGPWLSRPMRRAVGLASPEEAVGQAAHDFVACACAAPEVVLSCPRRRDHAPAVPARWLTRLDALLQGHGLKLPAHPATFWAAAMDQPADGPRPVSPPRPCPPLALRPRRLSVTEIETWQRDPYAIHARHILRLNALDPLDQSTEAADYGSLVHAGLHRFLSIHGADWPDDAADRLRAALAHELQAARLRPALEAWWAPRFDRIADWVAEHEARRRIAAAPAYVLSELRGDWTLRRRDFRLTGRADRIDIANDGSLTILDYKTGQPPGRQDIAAGLALQLPLEAAMAAEGAFGEIPKGSETGAMLYWHLTGGPDPGQEKPIRPKAPATTADQVAAAIDRLEALIDAYDDPQRCYLSQPRPGIAPRYTDYAQLARVAEWAAVEDEGDDGEEGVG